MCTRLWQGSTENAARCIRVHRLHTRAFAVIPGKASNLRLLGGAGAHSNPRCREAFYGRIQRQFGALFGPTKSICAGENLFAWDSGLLRLSPIRFVRQVEGECSAMWNVRKLQVQMRATVWRCSPEFLPSSSQPHHIAATAMKNSVGDSRISGRVGRADCPPRRIRPTASRCDLPRPAQDSASRARARYAWEPAAACESAHRRVANRRRRASRDRVPRVWKHLE